MKKIYCLLLIGAGCLPSVQAQEDLRREYERFRQQQTEEFRDFVSRRDREFADFLKREWELFQEMQAVERPAEPKPDRAPVVPDHPLPVIPGPEVTPLPLPSIPVKDPGKRPLRPQTLPETVDAGFYGEEISVDISSRLKLSVGGASEKDVAAYWEKMSAGPYGDFIKGLRQLADERGLNDWGYYRLAEATAKAFLEDDNDRAAFLFYVLRQSGYDARLGRGDNRLCLLLPFTTQVYGISYFVIDGEKYYRLDGLKGALYTFGNEGKGKQGKALDLRQDRPLAIGGKPEMRELKLKGAEEMVLRVPFDEDRQAYYNDIPQTDLAVYFSYPMPSDTWQALYDGFAPLAEKYSLPEFVGVLLHFVQTSFEYKTDGDQFNREKYFFPEETVIYPYCDCEDRAVFFSCLVRNLTGAEVIGLDYPGHVAAAVCFGDAQVSGDALAYKGKTYVVCDPTYINASIGMTMPQYKEVNPEVVEF